MDTNIIIPRGCGCASDVEVGSYRSQVELPTPTHMKALGSIGCLQFRDTTCIDKCLVEVVQALWKLGVVTTGCCCGHNRRDGYIGIWRPNARNQPSADAEDADVSNEMVLRAVHASLDWPHPLTHFEARKALEAAMAQESDAARAAEGGE